MDMTFMEWWRSVADWHEHVMVLGGFVVAFIMTYGLVIPSVAVFALYAPYILYLSRLRSGQYEEWKRSGRRATNDAGY